MTAKIKMISIGFKLGILRPSVMRRSDGSIVRARIRSDEHPGQMLRGAGVPAAVLG